MHRRIVNYLTSHFPTVIPPGLSLQENRVATIFLKIETLSIVVFLETPLVLASTGYLQVFSSSGCSWNLHYIWA